MTRPGTLLRVVPSGRAPKAASPRPRMSIFDIRSFGAVGDARTDCTPALTQAVAAAERLGRPAVVRVPEGTFRARSFALASGVTLEVDGTLAGLVGDDALRDWPTLPPLPTYGRDRDGAKRGRYRALVFAQDSRQVAIRGRGTIDGSGAWWWDRRKSLKLGRPHLIEFYNTTGVEVTGLTLKDSAFWTVHPVYSSHVHVHGVTIRAPLYAPNVDGIDPDSCRRVLIEWCDISVGDDHIAIKAGVCGASSPSS